MEEFIVSARKYRPTDFSSVVGQEHITKTLERAIQNNQLAHALLFTGPRGVGKTTCARIVARRINQTSNDDLTDYSLNIFELDAASNNSVDDIRHLNEQVRVAPQLGRYKVYIIDEVHMLTTAAFNAFLKTLEEPPIHVKFILATTEKHKILPTILSRCQVYDFRRISVDEIVAHLQKICEKEGIQAEPMALHIIAQKSDGALRDALSIFDKMVSFSGKNLTFDETIKNLNVLDYEYYFKVVDSLLVNDPWQLLLIFKEILDHGHDAQIFINGLASHFRDLLVAGNNRTKSLLEVPHQIKNKYEEQASKLSPNDIFKALKTLNETDVKYKTSNNPRLLVELTLIQLSSIFKSKEPKK
ncbi:DNA polymerase III subunit gamma/tau [Schleiferia thermophila]|uniref:DNA polymerase III subunit gamma/tau n=1 Tax=Schleiferia thermophila TaxID=884107 RepID=UPI003EEE6C77